MFVICNQHKVCPIDKCLLKHKISFSDFQERYPKLAVVYPLISTYGATCKGPSDNPIKREMKIVEVKDPYPFINED